MLSVRAARQQLLREIAPLQHVLGAARIAGQREPFGALLHEDPDLVGAGNRRQVLADGDADAVEIQGAAERLPERHQPLELLGALLGVPGRKLSRMRFRLLLMIPAILMEEERRGQQHQRRHQRQPALPLDLARVVEAARNRRRKHNHQRGRQRCDQEEVLTAKNLHGLVRTILLPWCKLIA